MVTTTEDSGYFFVPLLAGSDYEVLPEKPGFRPGPASTPTTKGLTESKQLNTDVFLTPAEKTVNPNNTTGTGTLPTEIDPTNAPNSPDTVVRPRNPGEGLLVFKVRNCETGAPLLNLPLILKDMETGIESKVQTNASGEIVLRQSAVDLPVAREFAVINEALEMTGDGTTYVPTVKKTYFIFRGNEPNMTVAKEICLQGLKEGDQLVLKDIYYDYDKATLRPLSIVQLDKAYDYLVKNPGVKLELSSHTDSRATNDYNQALSQRRAQACVNYLIKVKGIAANRIVAKGYGETRPVNGCTDGAPCTEEEHQMNRRTEIRVLKTN